MTFNEVGKILFIVSQAYPNFKIANINDTAKAWHFVLEDYEYNQIAAALKCYMATSNSGFAPSVSELIGMTHKPVELNQLTEQQAWAIVRSAISRSIYHGDEEYKKLSPEIQQAVGDASQLYYWAQSNLETVDTVVASNFMRSYRAKLKQMNELNNLPVGAFSALADSGGLKNEQSRITSKD